VSVVVCSPALLKKLILTLSSSEVKLLSSKILTIFDLIIAVVLSVRLPASMGEVALEGQGGSLMMSL